MSETNDEGMKTLQGKSLQNTCCVEKIVISKSHFKEPIAFFECTFGFIHYHNNITLTRGAACIVMLVKTTCEKRASKMAVEFPFTKSHSEQLAHGFPEESGLLFRHGRERKQFSGCGR